MTTEIAKIGHLLSGTDQNGTMCTGHKGKAEKRKIVWSPTRCDYSRCSVSGVKYAVISDEQVSASTTCENESVWQHLTRHIIINSQFMLYFNLLTKTVVFNHTFDHSVCNEALDTNTIPEHSSWMRCEVIDQEIVVLMWQTHSALKSRHLWIPTITTWSFAL